METIKLIVVSDSASERDSALDILSHVDFIELVGDGKTGLEALGFLEELPVDLILLGPGTDGDGYALARELLRRNPGLAVIMMEHELTEETVRRAVAAGVRDVVLTPLEPSRLVQAIYLGVQDQDAAGVGEAAAGDADRAIVKARGRIITFFCTKGGVGKTFTSVNTAVALAQGTGKKVALVDLDLDFGNAALALNIISRRSLFELAEELSMLDTGLVESYLVAHPSGVKVLPAGTMPQGTEQITGEQVDTILRTLAATYDYVVVDMPPRITGPLDPAIREVDLLFLVTTPEVATVRNVKLIMKMLAAAGYPRSKVRVLLNREDRRSGIRSRDVEATLKEKLFAIIPADYKRVPASLNRGEPLVMLYPRTKAARAVKGMAVGITERRQASLQPAAGAGSFGGIVLAVILFPFRLVYRIFAFIFLMLLKVVRAIGGLVGGAWRNTKTAMVKAFTPDEAMSSYLRRVSEEVEAETAPDLLNEESRGEKV